MKSFFVDFIGIGAARCGTTWIAKCLEEHPQICFSKLKETTYFAEYTELFRGKNELFMKDFEWYKNLFHHCLDGQLKGEFSTDYIHNIKAPKLIYEYFPKTKLIVSLREPISRLVSYYIHLKFVLPRKKFNKDFFDLLKDEEFIYRSKYYEQLKNWFKYFSKEQIKILIYEEMKESPKDTISEIYEFIGVEKDFFPKSLFSTVNKATSKRKIIYRLVRKVNRNLDKYDKSGSIRNLFKKMGLKNEHIDKLIEKRVVYPSITAEEKKHIFNKYFRKDVESLEKLLNKDLSIWKNY